MFFRGLDPWYNLRYTRDMKTAISIPDPIFNAAEMTCKHLGISRSRLCTQAIATFLQANSRQNIKEALDRVYATMDPGSDPVLQAMQSALFREEKW